MLERPAGDLLPVESRISFHIDSLRKYFPLLNICEPCSTIAQLTITYTQSADNLNNLGLSLSFVNDPLATSHLHT